MMEPLKLLPGPDGVIRWGMPGMGAAERDCWVCVGCREPLTIIEPGPPTVVRFAPHHCDSPTLPCCGAMVPKVGSPLAQYPHRCPPPGLVPANHDYSDEVWSRHRA